MTNSKEGASLVFIRHGETLWNLGNRFQGHLDSELSNLGRAQAEAVGTRLRKLPFSSLYSSDLGRAYETAKIIAGHTGHEIKTDPELRERSLGVFEGLAVETVRQKYPKEYELYRKNPEYVIPNGESAQQHFERNAACFEKLAANHAGDTVVIVAHGGVLGNLFRYVLRLPLHVPRQWSLRNASLSVVSHINGEWKLETWGDVSHLARLQALEEI